MSSPTFRYLFFCKCKFWMKNYIKYSTNYVFFDLGS